MSQIDAFLKDAPAAKSDQGQSTSKPASDVDRFLADAPQAKRSIGAAINDTVIEVANAAAGGASSAANFLLPGNSFSKFVDKNIVEDGESKQSDLVKAEKQKFRTEMENAKDVGDESPPSATMSSTTRSWRLGRPLARSLARARR